MWYIGLCRSDWECYLNIISYTWATGCLHCTPFQPRTRRAVQKDNNSWKYNWYSTITNKERNKNESITFQSDSYRKNCRTGRRGFWSNLFRYIFGNNINYSQQNLGFVQPHKRKPSRKFESLWNLIISNAFVAALIKQLNYFLHIIANL